MSSRPRGRAPDLALRACLALALLIGFYVLAFALIAGLLAFCVLVVALLILEKADLPTGSVFVVGVAFGAAVVTFDAVVRSVWIPGHQAPEGVRATPESQPGLWAEVRDLAAATGAPVPAEIHLVPGVTAFIHQDSKVLGLVRGKVVLGLGIGLMSVLDRAELRSVLAHEFGHISGGDTRLGPLAYRAQHAIMRAVEVLRRKDKPVQKLLVRLFSAYFRLYARSTMAVSRAQERAADRASVRIAGPAAAARALETIGVADLAFDAFADRYVVPLWRCGHRPEDLYGGFRDFFAAQVLAEVRAAVLAEETGRWDSHPSIGERIRLIEAEAAPAPASPGPGPGPRTPRRRPRRRTRRPVRLARGPAAGAAGRRDRRTPRRHLDDLLDGAGPPRLAGHARRRAGGPRTHRPGRDRVRTRRTRPPAIGPAPCAALTGGGRPCLTSPSATRPQNGSWRTTRPRPSGASSPRPPTRTCAPSTSRS
ncbi:M48 family metallopeptidase [Spirillospora sp. NPDC029432]|uniref:M48 family metallopeptidase n=1 Tax=Spirillospora sp. NPDC029432 TaxID=3154599 RepID=UPI0034514153